MIGSQMKRILLIEDEVHKREELTAHLNDFLSEPKSIDVVDSVREAVFATTENDYDLIILDMALPTFTTSEEEGFDDGGLDQALGGVEILRTLQALGKSARIIIVTQYPDISVNGKRVKLRAAPLALSKKYGQEILGAVLYKYKSDLNRSKLQNIVGRVWSKY